ncbi:MAG: zinc-ribbon domain-containing protein [Phycisphaerales bacterium]|nr:zinc-ribbon domain-containing protein [Phycisphaerales bacterium]
MSDWMDQGPSQADIDRFNRDEFGYCPDCGVSVYDDAEFCPKCSMQISGRIRNKPLVEGQAQQRLTIIVVVLILLGFLSWLVF